MVLIRELRIPMPYTMQQYELGSEFSAAKSARLATGDAKSDSAIEIVKVEPYFDQEMQREGLHTRRIYHIDRGFMNYVPSWVTALLSKSALTIYEDQYTCFPKSETILTNEWFGDRLEFKIETRVEAPGSNTDNSFNLTKDQLKARSVVDVDINKYHAKDLPPQSHPSKTHLIHHEPSHLAEGWQNNFPCVIVHKLITLKVQIWGLQTRLEHWLMNFEEDLFTRLHVDMYSFTDEWINLSREEVDEYVEESNAPYLRVQQDQVQVVNKKSLKAKEKKDKKDKKHAEKGIKDANEEKESSIGCFPKHLRSH